MFQVLKVAFHPRPFPRPLPRPFLVEPCQSESNRLETASSPHPRSPGSCSDCQLPKGCDSSSSHPTSSHPGTWSLGFHQDMVLLGHPAVSPLNQPESSDECRDGFTLHSRDRLVLPDHAAPSVDLLLAEVPLKITQEYFDAVILVVTLIVHLLKLQSCRTPHHVKGPQSLLVGRQELLRDPHPAFKSSLVVSKAKGICLHITIKLRWHWNLSGPPTLLLRFTGTWSSLTPSPSARGRAKVPGANAVISFMMSTATIFVVCPRPTCRGTTFSFSTW